MSSGVIASRPRHGSKVTEALPHECAPRCAQSLQRKTAGLGGRRPELSVGFWSARAGATPSSRTSLQACDFHLDQAKTPGLAEPQPRSEYVARGSPLLAARHSSFSGYE